MGKEYEHRVQKGSIDLHTNMTLEKLVINRLFLLCHAHKPPKLTIKCCICIFFCTIVTRYVFSSLFSL